MTISTQCLECKHYTGLCTCEAFPDKIPQEIFDGTFDHINEYPGDNGIRFESESNISKGEKIIYIKGSSKIILFNKSERGTHTKLVTVHGKTKTFTRKQRVGRKEKDKVLYKSSHNFIKDKINLNINMRKGEKFTKDSLMGEQIIVSDNKGNKLDVWIKETPDMIQLSIIGAREKGTGIGTKYLLGLKDYSDFSGKKLVIPNITTEGKKYFSRFNWLKDDHIKLEWIENGKHQEYYPEDTMSYKSLKEVKKSSLHPDNLQGIDDLNESGIVGLVGGIHESETYICRFKDGSSAIHKTMEPGNIIGEVGAYETSKIIGWDIVPETIQCDYSKGEGSTQKWISNSSEPYDGFDDNAPEIEEKHLNDLSKIFILDMIIGNFDRHSGNIIIDKNDKCWAIDNEMIGKLNNAQLHIESLDEWAKIGEGSFTPMISVLKENFGNYPKMYQNFKNNVDKNINQVIQNKDKIIKYWSQYKDSKSLNTSIPIKESIKNIGFNIEYLEYYQNMEMNK